MDIKLVPFADKVAGSGSTTGAISADDFNQIKKILDAITSGLFDLDSTGTATTGTIKSIALPDIDLVDYFSDAVVIDGKISFGAGSGSGSAASSLPVGTAPTSFVVDDNINTAGFTAASGTLATDYEYSINGGSSYYTVTANPIAIGDVALAVGTVKIRSKATSSHTVSSTISNASAYTVSGGGGGSLTQLTAFDFYDTVSSMNGSPGSFRWDVNAGSSDIGYAVKKTIKIPSGQSGYVQVQCLANSVGGSSSGWLGLFPDIVNYTGYGDAEMACRKNEGGAIGYRYIGAPENGTANGTLADGGYLRIRTDGTIIYLERSIDQATWAIVTQRALSAPKDLYIHAVIYGGPGYNADQDKVSNIKYTGFVTA